MRKRFASRINDCSCIVINAFVCPVNIYLWVFYISLALKCLESSTLFSEVYVRDRRQGFLMFAWLFLWIKLFSNTWIFFKWIEEFPKWKFEDLSKQGFPIKIISIKLPLELLNIILQKWKIKHPQLNYNTSNLPLLLPSSQKLAN